jgi:hypothetical protein
VVVSPHRCQSLVVFVDLSYGYLLPHSFLWHCCRRSSGKVDVGLGPSLCCSLNGAGHRVRAENGSLLELSQTGAVCPIKLWCLGEMMLLSGLSGLDSARCLVAKSREA